MRAYLHGLMNYAKKLNVRFCVGGLDMPDRRKRSTSCEEEEDSATNMRPCGTTAESRTYKLVEEYC